MFAVLAFVFGVFNPLSQAQAQKIQAVVIPPEWNVYKPAGVPTVTNIPSELPLGSLEKIEDYEAPRFNTVGVTWQIYNPESGKTNRMFNTTLHTAPHFKSVAEAIAYREHVAQVLLDQILESMEGSAATNHMPVQLFAILSEEYFKDPKRPNVYVGYKSEILFGSTEFIREPNGTWHLAEDVHKQEVLSNIEQENYLMVEFPQPVKSATVIKPAYWGGLYTYLATVSETGNVTSPGTFEIYGSWINIPYTLAIDPAVGGTLRIILADGQKINYDLSTGKRYNGLLPLETKFEVDGTVLSLHGTGEFGATIIIESSSTMEPGSWRPFKTFKNSKDGRWTADLIQPSGPRKFFWVHYKEQEVEAASKSP